MAQIRKTPVLLDWRGEPIVRSVLKQEIAGPTVAGVRSIISGHPASGLTPHRLSSILRGAEAGDATSYLELAEEMEEKDLHYLSVLQQRKLAVSQLDITIEAATDDPADVAAADLCREWLARDTLQEDLADILDAIGKGFSLTEIIWETSETQWWPVRLETLLPQWAQFDRVDGKTVRIRDGSAEGQALAPFKYIDHRVKAKSGLPIRGGLARPVAWAWMFKNYAVKDWVAFAEVYGLPLRLGKYEPGASEADKATLLRAVADISSDAAAIVPKSMEITFEGTDGSADGSLFEKMADWFDRQVSRAVLGQDGTSAMQKGGGYAQSKTLDGVREDIEQADAKRLAATLRRDLFVPLIQLNLGAPASGKFPMVAIGRAEQWDAKTMMPIVGAFVDRGGKVELSVIRDKLGLPDPPKPRAGQAEPELLQPIRAAPAVPEADPADPAAPPKKTPPRPVRPANDPDDAEVAEAASVRFLRLLTAAAASGGPRPAPTDAIDRSTADQLDGWERLVAPLVEPIDDLLASCSTLEEARDRIIVAASAMDGTDLADLLARAGFSARLAGLAGADLN